MNLKEEGIKPIDSTPPPLPNLEVEVKQIKAKSFKVDDKKEWTTSKKVKEKDEIFIFNPKSFIIQVPLSSGENLSFPAKKGKAVDSKFLSELNPLLESGKLKLINKEK